MTVKIFHFELLILKIFYKYNEFVILITYNNLYYHQFRNIFIPRVTILGRLSLREIILCYRRFGYRVYESKNPLKIVSNFLFGEAQLFLNFLFKNWFSPGWSQNPTEEEVTQRMAIVNSKGTGRHLITTFRVPIQNLNIEKIIVN